MIIFGLTGGIAVGKSNISLTFIKNNIPVIDADQVARDVVKPNSLGLAKIIGAFGIKFLQADGSLNRSELGSLVFSDNDAMTQLNIIMSPLIQTEAAHQFRNLQQAGHRLACWDAALLIEVGNVRQYQPIIVAHCHRDLQIERLMSRNNLTHAEAMARIESQLSTSHKLMMADFSIDTSNTIEESIKQTEIIITYLKKLVSCEACQLSEELDVMVIKPEHTCQTKSRI